MTKKQAESCYQAALKNNNIPTVKFYLRKLNEEQLEDVLEKVRIQNALYMMYKELCDDKN